MNPLQPLSWVPSLVSTRVHTWSVSSQLGARRNAMVACTALAARRAERQDVEAFLASRRAAPATHRLPVTAPLSLTQRG
jgi:hypothetical protein